MAKLLALALFGAVLVLNLEVGFSRVQTFGVDYGQIANNLPPPTHVVNLLKSMHVDMARIFNSNASTIRAFRNSGIPLWISIADREIYPLAQVDWYADQWVLHNLAPHYPSTHIQAVLVGNEVLGSWNQGEDQNDLVPAMRNLRAALDRHGYHHIMVSTPLAGDALEASSPPSRGTFRRDQAHILTPLVRFIHETNSVLCVNIYPYYAYSSNPQQIPLEFALLKNPHPIIHDGKYSYISILDAMIDSFHAALEKLGYSDVKIVVTETGWPSAGSIYATKENAAIYNQRLIHKLRKGQGTPRRPHYAVPMFIFSLFNENLKGGQPIEKYWGLLHPNGEPVYHIHYT